MYIYNMLQKVLVEVEMVLLSSNLYCLKCTKNVLTKNYIKLLVITCFRYCHDQPYIVEQPEFYTLHKLYIKIKML